MNLPPRTVGLTVSQLKSDILSAIEAGDLKRPELLEQVSGKHQLLLKALQQLCDDGKVDRTGSGEIASHRRFNPVSSTVSSLFIGVAAKGQESHGA